MKTHNQQSKTSGAFEQLERRQLMAAGVAGAVAQALTNQTAAITSFALADSKTGKVLATLSNNATVNLPATAANSLAIVALTSGSTAAVKFGLDAKANYRTEKSAPFALDGDTNGALRAFNLAEGTHTLTGTPSNLLGVSGKQLKINFTIDVDDDATSPTNPTNPTKPVEPETPTEEPETPAVQVGKVTDLALVNAQTGAFIQTISDNSTIDLGKLSASQVAIVARTNGVISSVRFGLNDVANYRTESSAPFAFDGDMLKSYTALSLATGAKHTITATPIASGVEGSKLTVRVTFTKTVTTPTTPTNPTTPTTPTNPSNGNVAKPVASNTGPYNTSVLKQHNGLFTTSYDGQVIENLIINGGVDIKHHNVTLKNSIVLNRGIKVHKGVNNTTVDYVEVTGASIGTAVVSNEAGPATFRHMEIHHVGSDGFRPGSNQTYEYNYIHHLGMTDGSHADGMQFYHADENLVFRNIDVRYNNFDMPEMSGFRANAAIFMGHRVDDFMAEKNWFNGGGFTATRGDANGNTVIYRDNFFGRDAKFGLRSMSDPGWNSTTWSNNRYEDNGALITGRW